MKIFNKILISIIFTLITFTYTMSSEKHEKLHKTTFDYKITKELMLANQIDSTYYSQFAKNLEKMFGRNKLIPEKYKLSILIALSFYPELADTKIIFKESSISTTLNARPKTISLLFGKQREYIVRINSSREDSIVTIDEVPFNARIGLIGHEFAHFIDYQDKSLWGIADRLLDYTSKKKKAAYEKEIDLITIKRGLGWQLYHWSYFIQNDSDASAEYKQFKEYTYLSPKEILQHTVALTYGEVIE